MLRGDYEWNDGKLLLNNSQICLISRHSISLDELPNLPRIIQKMDHTAQKDDHKWWYEHFSSPPSIFMEVNRPGTCKEMVMQGLGYCILPKYMFKKEELTEDLFILPLTHIDGQPFLRSLWALYREEDTTFTVVKAFVEYLKQHYNLN
ncbi:substrate-binding domain-containing protein [Niallia oryzisoli]|uniref:Substrate-binding domain-containing protein n=1 Tax=Niallia oryzisoli TaxID=1737571 RepID=A0ABZ2CH93_9BACI